MGRKGIFQHFILNKLTRFRVWHLVFKAAVSLSLTYPLICNYFIHSQNDPTSALPHLPFMICIQLLFYHKLPLMVLTWFTCYTFVLNAAWDDRQVHTVVTKPLHTRYTCCKVILLVLEASPPIITVPISTGLMCLIEKSALILTVYPKLNKSNVGCLCK